MKKLAQKKIVLLTVPFTIAVVAVVTLFGTSCCSVKQISPDLIRESQKMIVEGVPRRDTPQADWWLKMKERDPDFEWKMAIAFYGKVVDMQDGTPIQGAEIKLQWSDMSRRGTSERTLYSDAEGKFSLTGVRGKGLSVYLGREGYYVVQEGTQNSFEYAAFFEEDFHLPDPQNPVIFKLRKAQRTSEGLLARTAGFRVSPNGEATPIVLRTTKRGTPADITISMTHSNKRDNNGNRDWSVKIAGVNGAGLIESNEEFMFEAPVGGYKSQYNYAFKVGEKNYRSKLDKKYYVRSADGKTYGRIEVEYNRAYGDDDAAVYISFYINPTGSRNLASRPGMNLRLSDTLQPIRQ